MRIDVVNELKTPRSFRVEKIAGMFDVPLADKVRQEWHTEIDLASDWQIGLIVGPSGCGKSSIARALWPEQYVRGYTWDDRSILDNFPDDLTSDAIIDALTNVGFGSPPHWVKPYHALSTGQQMRCDIARALVSSSFVVFDEFTSVVDRKVAQVGAAAIAKAVRRDASRKFIAVTCHEDVIDWLAPDWTLEPHTLAFDRRRLRRPDLALEVARVDQAAWPIFRPYHYLSADLNPSAVCYGLFHNDAIVAFCAILPLIGFKSVYRFSRMVVLPEWQGIGVGSKFFEVIGDRYRAQQHRIRMTISHPGLLHYCNRSAKWKLVDVKRFGTQPQAKMKRLGINATHSAMRGVVTFEYVG